MKKNFVLLVVFVLLLAGCSEKEGTSNSAAGKESTLKIFDAMAYGTERYDEVISNFEAKNPGVKVEVQHAPNDTTPLLNSRISSGDIPDVFAVQVGTIAETYYGYAYDWTTDTDVLSKFQGSAVKTGLDKDNAVKSLPWTYENMGLLYNKDVFENAGITELPRTISELEQVCIKLEKSGVVPIAIAAKETWVLRQLITHFMMDKSLDAAGVVDALNNHTLTFSSMANFQYFSQFLDLAVQYGPDKPLEVDWEKSENMLANGEAGIIHMGDWCQAILDKIHPDLNVGFLPFPVSENPEDCTVLSSVSWTYIVNKDSENLDMARDYAEYILTSDDGIDWMTQTIGNVPAAKISSDIKIKGTLANDASSYIAKGFTNGWIHSLMPKGYDSEIGPTIQSYMMGEISQDELTEQAQDFWVN